MKKISKRDVSFLRTIVTKNKHVDFHKINLSGEVNLDGIRFDGIPLSNNSLLLLLKAYQRLLRITEGMGDEIIWSLLQKGYSSAMEIAAMGKNAFIKCFTLENTLTSEIAAEVYKNARAKRSQILPQFINMHQNNEPHIRNASI